MGKVKRQRAPGLLFPKPQKARTRKAHAKSSILQKDTDRRRCWLCMQTRGDYSEHSPGALHKHHIYMGPLRSISEAEGFFVWLCPEHHEHGPDAVHRSIDACRRLQREAQSKYEQSHTREEFTALIGRSYL